ncbi:AAA family ATPase [Evansella sp. AB-P1]|uniref:AAA family ATPase n=1 Tax=Evansella sp. AB-P1 TaxID=3037653 RepID=UPI00241C9071|nr:AAA family ATPase [Evansella sp. AB-P1]MDG5788469.1 AAA family ATPase [Evansella sp. AB-P1]
MKMKWYVLSENESLIYPLKVNIRKMGSSIKYYLTEKNLKKELKPEEAAVIFLHESETYDIYELCGELTYTFPLTSIILITEHVDLKSAMYVGAVDVLQAPLKEIEIIEAATKAKNVIEFKLEKLPPKEVEEADGNIITVCSTKGGVGKTTISVNLAVSLAKGNVKVAIVDLDLQFGDISISLDLQPKKTIYDWIKESYEVNRGDVLSFMTKHQTGIEIMSAPTLPEFADIVTGESVSFLLERLKQHYDYIIIDTPPALIETSLVALEQSSTIFLITSMDLPTIKNGKIAIDTLELLGLKDRIKVVLNRDTPMDEMTLDTVEKILGLSVYSRIPSDYKIVVTSLNQGQPFVLTDPKASVSKGMKQLALKIIDKSDNKSEGNRFISRLLKKNK